MKRVLVMRHGKSSWENPRWSDLERPLLGKGRKRTKKIGRLLKKTGIRPDLILSSPAKRARQTAEIMREILGETIPVKEEQVIYFGDEDDLSDLLLGLSETVNTVLIVGHNPDLTDWVNRYKEEKIWNLPTSGIFGVAFDTERWEDLPLAGWEEILYVEPKGLSFM